MKFLSIPWRFILRLISELLNIFINQKHKNNE